MKVIAMINQKGGVGKTTSVVNLGAALATAARDVLLIDMDPQSHMTLHLSSEPPEGSSVYDLLTQQASIDAVTVKAADHLWMAPAVIDLAAAEMELTGVPGREQILRKALAAADERRWDFVLIDCPPSLGLLTLNALAAADEVIIPLQPHFLALQGLGKLLETISLVQHRINPRLRVGGVILCMYEHNTRLAGEVVADLEAFFAAAKGTNSPWSRARIFKSIIRRNIKLAESPSFGQTIFQYEPASHGAADYASLACEFIEWDKLRRQEDDAPPPDATAAAPANVAADLT
ncbi:MAG: AAA family ATPase [Planctomycetaceae bacterium]|nr:AAA family ATPase [Planctomycetaceae bacterium]